MVPRPIEPAQFVDLHLPVVGSIVMANINLVNVGRTPAQSVTTYARISRLVMHPRLGYNLSDNIKKLNEMIDQTFKDVMTSAVKDRPNAMLRREDVAPGAQFLFSRRLPFALSQDDVTELQRGDSQFLVYLGFIRYTDPFGQKLQTEFCWYWFGTDPVIWHICSVHNVIR